MPMEWSGLSPGLLLALDRRDSEPLRSQAEGQLGAAIRPGRLPVGERLPTPRELGRALGLSRGLGQDCYRPLQAEGCLSTRVGSATALPPLTAGVLLGVPDPASFPRYLSARSIRAGIAAVCDLLQGQPRAARSGPGGHSTTEREPG